MMILLVVVCAVLGQEPQGLGKTDLLDFPKPKPAAPVDVKALDEAIQRGINFLVTHQNADGSFGSPTRTKDLNIYAPVPGAHHAFQAATTALGITALIDAGSRGSLAREALEKAEAWLLENLPKVKRATPDAIYNVWAHAYAIQALVRMHRRVPTDQERQRKIEDLIRLQFDYLDRYESVDGGWGYYDFKLGSKKPATDSTSFTTAAVLVAFREAADLGVAPPEKLVKRAVASIHRQRKPDFTYLYGEYLKWVPMHGINVPGGSLGRSQACNIATLMWGDKAITERVLTCWLNRLISQNMWLDIGRKRPIPHESKFAVAGYFYYFGHYYAGYCIHALPEAERAFYQNHLARILLEKQEQDGSWFDYPLYDYGHAYGTAYAISTLMMCKPTAQKSEPPEQDDAEAAAPSPGRRVSGHAHNDYLHARPLYQALELGYASIEADIHLKNGELLVGHDDWQLTKGRTLESLYLAPLASHVKEQGTSSESARSRPLILLVDIKTAAAPTYAALHPLLEKYGSMLTEVSDGQVIERAVTVVISGNVPRKEIAAQPRRFAAIDGRLSDLKSDLPSHLMPLISDHWGRHFSWKGEGEFPAAEREKLNDFVAQIHASGRQLRFWATPEREAVWQELSQAGVDLIGTDHLKRLTAFLAESGDENSDGSDARSTFALTDSDRVVLLGATFLERDRHYGELEAMLRLAFPGKRFMVRNLSWPGDTTTVQMRPLNFGSIEKHLDDLKPTVVFMSYGMSEAQEGAAGLEGFLAGYRSLISKARKHARTIVLISPFNREPQLALGDETARSPAEFNQKLALYVKAIEDLAASEQCHFVNLFNTFVPTCMRVPRLTDNGIHLSRSGYHQAGRQIARQLGWHLPEVSDESTRELRAEIVRKDELFFNRWRAHNGEYIYGRRAAAGGGNAGNPSFVNEFAQFEKLLSESDARIARIASTIPQSR